MSETLALTTKEVLNCVKISATTLRKMINEGKFPPPFIGGGRRGANMVFRKSDIERFMKVNQ